MNRKWYLQDVPKSCQKDGPKTDPPRSSVQLDIRWVPYCIPNEQE